MSYDRFREKLKRENCLGQVDTLGSFDFYTTTISLEAVDQNKLKALATSSRPKDGVLSPDSYRELAAVMPLATHEYVHFIDATSTIWGLQHIELMNAAYSAADFFGETEQGFHHAKVFFDHTRSLRLPDYYTIVESGVENQHPWKLNISIGRAFDLFGRVSDRPIMFGRFRNARGQDIARSPISMVSLLEASAMAQEVIVSTQLLASTPKDFQVVEEKLYIRDTLKLIYDPKLTEYSVCVHLVANQQSCPDIHLAFRLCAILTRVVLNFPELAFQEVVSKCDVAKVAKVPAGEEFAQALQRGVMFRDRGTLFYLLTQAMPQGAVESKKAMTDGVRIALESLGTSYDCVSNAFVSEAEAIRNKIGKSRLRHLDLIADAGLSNLKRISLIDSEIRLNTLDLPKAWLGDMTEANPFYNPKGIFSKVSVDDIFDELSAGESWIRRFSEGCFYAPQHK